jgi:outer membrane biosynthesis protein TonB
LKGHWLAYVFKKNAMSVPLFTILGLALMVVLTLAGVWYVSRRLRQLEAKVKLGCGLSGAHIKDMDKVAADVAEVKHGMHSLAHEMGLRFVHPKTVAKPPSQQTQNSPSQKTQNSPSQKTQNSPSQQPKASEPPSQQPKSPNEKAIAESPSQQPKSPNEKAIAEPPSQQPKSPNEKAIAEPPSQQTKSPNENAVAEPPKTPQRGKGKGKGKGKTTLMMNLFPEFVGPITIPRSPSKDGDSNVPRVEEMGDECEGGVCSIESLS